MYNEILEKKLDEEVSEPAILKFITTNSQPEWNTIFARTEIVLHPVGYRNSNLNFYIMYWLTNTYCTNGSCQIQIYVE